MQMFLEHVLMKHREVPGIIAYARRLDYVSLSHCVLCTVRLVMSILLHPNKSITCFQSISSDPDFLKVSTLEKVRRFIVSTHKELKILHKLRYEAATIIFEITDFVQYLCMC